MWCGTTFQIHQGFPTSTLLWRWLSQHLSLPLLGNMPKEKTYLCDYSYAGSRWSIEIAATSFEDAEARLRALSKGQVAGEVKAVIPVGRAWISRLWKWIKGA